MKLQIIGAPVDFGAGRRGVEMGPSAMRHTDLVDRLDQLGHDTYDSGNVAVPIRDRAKIGDPKLRYLDILLPVQRQIADAVTAAIARERFPIVIGGDHSIGLGSIAAAARNRKIGVIWIDTHGDFNTHETTLSGNIHGMPLAALAGFGHPDLITIGGWRPLEPAVDPANMVVLGARDLDPAERELMAQAGVNVFSMAAIDRHGILHVVEKAIEVAGRGTEGIYVSFDLDVMDPAVAPGVGTPSPGGLTVREGHLAMELLAESGRMVGLDMVEVNPILDEHNRTAELGVSLMMSALGKRVWEIEEIPRDG